MKLFYYITMSLITICIVVNIFHLIHRSYHSIFFSAINILSPVVAFIYLLTVFMKRKRLLKKLHDQYEKFFSKN